MGMAFAHGLFWEYNADVEKDILPPGMQFDG